MYFQNYNHFSYKTVSEHFPNTIIGQFFEVLNSTYKKLRVQYYSKEEND